MFLLSILSCGGGGKSGSTVSPSGTAVLTWSAPETNVDGTPLTDLAGYKIYYGKTSGGYSEMVIVSRERASCTKLSDRTECTYTVTNLNSGKYYFAVTAYDLPGIESSFSNEVSKEIP